MDVPVVTGCDGLNAPCGAVRAHALHSLPKKNPEGCSARSQLFARC